MILMRLDHIFPLNFLEATCNWCIVELQLSSALGTAGVLTAGGAGERWKDRQRWWPKKPTREKETVTEQKSRDNSLGPAFRCCRQLQLIKVWMTEARARRAAVERLVILAGLPSLMPRAVTLAWCLASLAKVFNSLVSDHKLSQPILYRNLAGSISDPGVTGSFSVIRRQQVGDQTLSHTTGYFQGLLEIFSSILGHRDRVFFLRTAAGISIFFCGNQNRLFFNRGPTISIHDRGDQNRCFKTNNDAFLTLPSLSRASV